MNGYTLSKNWFSFCYENPEKIKPIHTAVYFFAIDHCNRLGWKEKFGMPSSLIMEAIGVSSYKTYINALNDIIGFGFIKMIEKSKNQFTSNIIALVNFTEAHTKALTKASSKHIPKQVQSIVSINKPINSKLINYINEKEEDDFFIQSLTKAVEGKKELYNLFKILKEKEKSSDQKEKENYQYMTLDEFKAYFKKSGYSEQGAIDAFNYYNNNNWKDRNGKPVNPKGLKNRLKNNWMKSKYKTNDFSIEEIMDEVWPEK